MSLKTVVLFFVITLTLHSQQYHYAGEIGEFRQASSFTISSLGFIYVTDVATNEIVKYDLQGNKLKDIGGFGWGNAQFDSPSDICTGPLNIYVADKNNHRIQIFDKDLNLITLFKSNSVSYNTPVFAYPVAVGISNQGDMFILDSDNRNIHKYDINGSYINSFGGIDAGELSISEPLDLHVDGNKSVFILNGQKELLIYDTFGNPQAFVQYEFYVTSINGYGRTITLTSEDQITILDATEPGLPGNKLILADTPEKTRFISSLLHNNILYILTETKILIYHPFP